MREYFTIMLRENSDEGLKLLTQKLNSGFTVNQRVEVGRSTLVILEKYTRQEGEVNYRTIEAATTPDLTRY